MNYFGNMTQPPPSNVCVKLCISCVSMNMFFFLYVCTCAMSHIYRVFQRKFLCTYLFVGPCKFTIFVLLIKYLFQTQHHFGIIKVFIWVVQKFSKQNKKGFIWPNSPIFSKGSITFKTFLIFIIKESSKKFRCCASGPKGLCFKIVNLCRTEADLTSKWGRIFQAVYWWHQNQSSCIVRCCVMSRGVAKKLADHLLTHNPPTHKVIYEEISWATIFFWPLRGSTFT